MAVGGTTALVARGAPWAPGVLVVMQSETPSLFGEADTSTTERLLADGRIAPYYQDETVTLYHARCEMVMGQLVEESVAMVLADLPYATTRNQWDRPLDFKLLWHHFHRLCPARAAVVLFGSGLFSAKTVMANPDEYRYSLVWDKQAVSGFLNAKRQPLRSHEDIHVFYGSQATYHPQMVQTGRKSHSRGRRTDRTVNHYGAFENTPVADTEGQYPRSILAFKRPKEGLHPTQKPVELCSWLIRTFTDPGQMVLDPTCGSATTLVAAKVEGRRAIGIEVTEAYCEVAAGRLAKA